MSWLPTFACPECRGAAPLIGLDGSGFVCPRCRTAFVPTNGVHRFLSRQRAEAAAPFERQYRLVRERDGHRRATLEYLRMLPVVPRDDPHVTEWRIRRESFSLLERHAMAGGASPLQALDLGAGNGWLSHRLAAAGCRVVAVNRLDDDADGLGACRHYEVPFAAVQADFNALPFEPAQFDLAVFDGSLHYAANPAAALAEARRMLRPGGTVAVMDSPMFARARDGEAMVAAQLRRIQADHGIGHPQRSGPGFLTFALLDRVGARLGMRGRFFPSRGPVMWRLGRQLARLTLGRAPAAFGVWVAR